MSGLRKSESHIEVNCPINSEHRVKKSETFHGQSFLFCSDCREDVDHLKKNPVLNSSLKAGGKKISPLEFQSMSYLERLDLVKSNLQFNKTSEFETWDEADQANWNRIFENYNYLLNCDFF